MEPGPFPYASDHGGRQTPTDDLQRVNVEFRLVARVNRMEMRGRVIVPVHRDRDSVEHADSRDRMLVRDPDLFLLHVC